MYSLVSEYRESLFKSCDIYHSILIGFQIFNLKTRFKNIFCRLGCFNENILFSRMNIIALYLYFSVYCISVEVAVLNDSLELLHSCNDETRCTRLRLCVVRRATPCQHYVALDIRDYASAVLVD